MKNELTGANLRAARARFENDRDIVRAMETHAQEHGFKSRSRRLKLAERLAHEFTARAIRDAAMKRQLRLVSAIHAFEERHGKGWKDAK